MKKPIKLENTFLNRKNFPFLLIGGLTLFLLFLFGSEQYEEDNLKNRNFANELYSATLKPLFSSENIDKKDLLTFAVMGNLPLIESDRVLQVTTEPDGKETLEILNDTEIVKNDDYSLIVDKLNLTVERKEKFDSILNAYQGELSNLIYFGDDSLIAVDPKIGLLRNSLNYDLSTFIREIKYNLQDENHLNVKLYDLLNNISENKPRNYIVFTPDSVLKREFQFVESSTVENEFNKKNKFLKTVKGDEPIEESGFSIEIDSNFARVTLDNLYNENVNLQNLNIYNMVADTSWSDMKLSFKIAEDSLENISLKFSYADSLDNTIRFEMKSDEIGATIINSIKIFSGKNIDEWIEYGIKMDSISRANSGAGNGIKGTAKQRDN
ncbi:MAG: hypothetical protein L3J41_09335 [Melioribacteraceae bacterium]|nr:hypothetical protein [Melioribacteraceae bacterium]